ncbi:hypothetical protein FRB99_002451 [Tulasnella sp. 403]|nr:hypothetical protein FRB99_002451 [Tulasnella sp. 403]
MPEKLLDVQHQLVFYGAYHSNPINIAIHIVGVPIILWYDSTSAYPSIERDIYEDPSIIRSFLVFLTQLPTPAFFPAISFTVNQYFTFHFNWALIFATLYESYYLALLPSAAVLYAPQITSFLLFANNFAARPDGVKIAAGLHVFAWVMQIIGHTFAEKRAPAILDNVLGAVVLAPFFVHLELLFALGFYPTLYKKIVNGVGVEIAKFRRQEAQKKRSQ